MVNNQKVLAIIPARKNSKGLPGKNIVDLAGKPLIAWSIIASQQSTFIDKTVISTDGQEIANIASSHGASVPFLRPARLAMDDTPGVSPIIHACEQLPGFDLVVVLQPTSPLRTSVDIDNAIEQLCKQKADFCVSVTTPKHHPNWLFKACDNGRLDRYEKQPLSTTRQSLQKLYALNGAIYVARIGSLMEHKALFSDNTVPYFMEPERSFDIDSLIDLKICQMIMEQQR